MGVFDFLRSKPVANPQAGNHAFTDTMLEDEALNMLIHQAIAVFKGNPSYTPAELVAGIQIFSRDASLATSLYCFIPQAFCRIIYPEPSYAGEFSLVKNGKTVFTAHFSASRVFNRVLEESQKSYAFNNDQQKLLNILIHSAEFDALNKALHAGSQLGDLMFSPPLYSL